MKRYATHSHFSQKCATLTYRYVTSFAIPYTVNQWSAHCKAIRAKFFLQLTMWTDGQYDWVSSHNSWSPQKCMYHSNSVDHRNASLPNATINRLLSFLSNFSCFVTNFTQMCYWATFFIKTANSHLSFNEIIVITQQQNMLGLNGLYEQDSVS